LIAAAGVIFKIERDQHIIEIQTDDADIAVEMRRNGEVLRVHDHKTNQSWTIDTKSNQISQADSADGLSLPMRENETIVLRRMGKDVFTVKRVQSPGKLERDLIQGTWRVAAAEVGGQQMPPEIIAAVKPTLNFSADKVFARPEGTVPKPFLDMSIANGVIPKEAATLIETGVEGIYHLDATKSPKQFDVTTLGKFHQTGLGLYQLEGDTLKLCLAIDPGKVGERPTEFSAKAGENRVILTLKRLPAAKPGQDKLAAATKAADAWLKLIDEGKYGEAWERSSSPARQRTP